MAVLPYDIKRNITPVDERGVVLGKMNVSPQGTFSNVGNLSDQDILDQISVINDIQNTRGLISDESAYLANLQAEQRNRQQGQISAEEQKILDIFGGGGGGAGNFDQSQLIKDLTESTANQRGALETIFGERQRAGIQSLNDLFNQQRGQRIDEAAALGNLRNPNASIGINQIDAERNRNLANFITGLQGQYGQAQTDLESNLQGRLQSGREFGANLGLESAKARAGLLQGGSQFGKTFGLEQQKFGESRRNTALDRLFQQQSMDEARRLGELQAKASEPSILGQIGGLFGGLGKVAGGIGQLYGGVGSFRKSKTAGAY